MSRRNRGNFQNTFVSGGVYHRNSKVVQPSPSKVVIPQQTPNTTEASVVSSNVIVLTHSPTKDEAEMDAQTTEAAPEIETPRLVEVITSGEKVPFKQLFVTRKKSSVRAKERKLRQNRQLRKAIFPKNALMALNEVKGITTSDFVLHSNEFGFTALVVVNNVQYEGKGISKVAAKNNACEKALRDYVIEKMRQKPRSSKTQKPPEQMDTESSATDQNMQDDDSNDVPMVNLASFALFKLFSEWETEGYNVPEMHPDTSANANGENPTPKEPKKVTVRNELPDGWETMHPATLLCMMRPGLTYTDYGPFGEKPNVLQKVGVVVDNEEYMGMGRSKKLARRAAAVSVCNVVFGTNFDG